MWWDASDARHVKQEVHEIPQAGCNSQCAGWRLGVSWVSGWRRVRWAGAAEVTLQESTAANPEYADFHCASRRAAAGFLCVFFVLFFFVVDFIVGDQFTGPLLTFTPAHLPPDRQNNSHPSVHTLTYKHKFMQKCGAISEYTSSSSQTSHRRSSESAFYTSWGPVVQIRPVSSLYHASSQGARSNKCICDWWLAGSVVLTTDTWDHDGGDGGATFSPQQDG